MSNRRLSTKHLCLVHVGLSVALLIALFPKVGRPHAARAVSGRQVPAAGLHEMGLVPDGLSDGAWQAILDRSETPDSAVAATRYSEFKLRPPSPSSAGSGFGAVVALSGDTLVVGAYDDEVNGLYSGSVYVFERSGGVWSQQARLDPDDGDDGDYFGYAVALSGDTLVVGAYGDEDPNGDRAGSVYVFEKGSGWADGHASQVAKLDPGDGDGGDQFGAAVALSGDTLVVGAGGDEDPNGVYAGSAYVFERGSGWADGGANQVAKLDPDDGDSYDFFGYAVALSGDTLVVGAYGDEDPNGSHAGSAYVFERGSGWADGGANQMAKLSPSDGDSDDYFGYAVALSGDTLVVGAYEDEDPNGSDAGSAYVFERGSGWADGHANQVAKLDPDDGDSDDRFGATVALSGDTLVVAAYGDEDPNGYSAGSAYVFEKGAGWSDGHANQVAKLDPDAGDSVDYFGYAVALSGDTLVVGAPNDERGGTTNTPGALYVFMEGSGWSDGHANQAAKLIPSAGGEDAYDDQFGRAMALSGDTLVVGAPGDAVNGSYSGSVYVFERSGGVWSQQARLDPDDGDDGDYFGIAVALSGDTLVVGAYYDEDPNGDRAGSVYVFEKGSGWADGHANQTAKLAPDDGDSNHYFGYAVALSGDTLVVGAYGDADPNGPFAGSAYVFERGSGWADGGANQAAKLAPNDGDINDYFGYAVALSGDTLVVGAWRDEDPNGSDAGSAYVFERGSGWADGHANQVAKLDPDDGDSDDRFGATVALSSDTLVVGAYFDEDPNGSHAGSAYVFERGSGWADGGANQMAKLSPSDGGTDDYFGYAVTLSGDTLVVGAYRDDDAARDAGAAYVFVRCDIHIYLPLVLRALSQ